MSFPSEENSFLPAGRTVAQHWEHLVARDPQAMAIIEAEPGRVYTRAEIDQLARSWVFSVSDSPLHDGMVIAFALPNSAQWLATCLGIWRLGGIPLPIDSSEPIAQQLELARGAGAHFFWSDSRLKPLENKSSRRAREQNICLLKLTSGSTGQPRGLAFTHGEMLADSRQICSTMQIRADDLNLAIVPFGHSYGLGNIVIPLLVQGTAALCVSAPLPQAIAETCLRWKPTVFPAVPALLRLLTLAEVPASVLESLRTVISAGSVLSPEIAQAFFEKYRRRVHGFYGSSETGGITYDRTGEATLVGRSVGTALDGVVIRFDRAHRFRVESAAVFTVRNHRRGSTQQGQHLPADRAELNAFGELCLLGRVGRMMKIAGRRIDLAAMEATLRKIPRIRDAYLTPHPRRPDELAAIIASDASLEDARAFLRQNLAPWKVPKKIIVLSAFPVTGRGKTDTKALQKKLVESK